MYNLIRNLKNILAEQDYSSQFFKDMLSNLNVFKNVFDQNAGSPVVSGITFHLFNHSNNRFIETKNISGEDIYSFTNPRKNPLCEFNLCVRFFVLADGGSDSQRDTSLKSVSLMLRLSPYNYANENKLFCEKLLFNIENEIKAKKFLNYLSIEALGKYFLESETKNS